MKRPGIPLEAIEAVYRTRAADFFRFALAKTGEPERARDAVQEGFARAIRGRAMFQGTGPLEAWVARCVLNAALDLNRVFSRMQSKPEDLPADSMTASDDSGSVIREAVRQLPQRQRSDDSEHEHARAADEAGRRAREAEARAMADAERIAAGAHTGEMKEEELRQTGVIYGALIAVGVVMVQGLLEASSLDTSARVSSIAFAVAIPLLAALVLVNRQEAFRGRQTTSVSVTLARVIAQLAAFVGLVAGFWDITWVAGVTFFVAALVAVGVHSAGFWRVESPHPPATTE